MQKDAMIQVEEYRFQILAMEVMPDHIHMLVDNGRSFIFQIRIKIKKGNLASPDVPLHPELKNCGEDICEPVLLCQRVSDQEREQAFAHIEALGKEKEKRKP